VISKPGVYQVSFRANLSFQPTPERAAAVTQGRTFSLRLVDRQRTDEISRGAVLGGAFTCAPTLCNNPAVLCELRVGKEGAKLQLEYVPVEGIRTPKVDNAVLQVLRIGE